MTGIDLKLTTHQLESFTTGLIYTVYIYMNLI